uniref:Uncharacterized protein n=1 Tax=Cliftonaea pectinata TaxID=2007206 RepID=A0A1Z1MQL0_9FLOR|nr:hypothetical protein [Cliftonaea pectinata]ARW68169.1 hypothetical protein [Cliftonaea pectinata]
MYLNFLLCFYLVIYMNVTSLVFHRQLLNKTVIVHKSSFFLLFNLCKI